MISEGDRAPNMDVTASDGRTVNLSHPGHPLVLYFYPKDDTSGCTREAQDFTSLAADFAKAGALIVGVSRDPMKKHEKFIDKYDLKVALASDTDGSFCEAFGTWIEKSMYGRKYMGIDRATFLINRDGTIYRIRPPPTASSPTNMVSRSGSPATPTARCARRSAPGARSRCTAANIWASTAPPSSSTATAW